MLKGAVIGFGRMGVTHYALLNTHPEVEFSAVCDLSTSMNEILKRYMSVPLFSDYHKMLTEVELDFVIIATATVSHAEIAKAAMDKGLHVFIEKPLSLTASQSEELVRLAQEKNIVNQVGYFLRFNEALGAVKRFIAEGMIGDVVHYKNEMYGRTVLKSLKSSWRNKKEMGGGCMLDFGSHCIDSSNYLFGPVESVSGSLLKSIYSTAVEDTVFSTLEHENGVSGNIMVNWSDESYRRPYNRIEIFGTKGRIVADRQEYRLYLREARSKDSYVKGWNVRYLPQLDKGVRFAIRGPEFTNQLDHFIDCIRQGGRQTICTFADALRTDRVMQQIRDDFARRAN